MGIQDVIAVSAGAGYSLALKSDGTVWKWGGWQYGDGSEVTPLISVPAKGVQDVVAIAVGDGQSLALRRDGTIWAWGTSIAAERGDGTQYTLPSAPRQVKVLDPAAPAFRAMTRGDRNPDGSLYADLYEAEPGLVVQCTTNAGGRCQAGVPLPAKPLFVMARYADNMMDGFFVGAPSWVRFCQQVSPRGFDALGILEIELLVRKTVISRSQDGLLVRSYSTEGPRTVLGFDVNAYQKWCGYSHGGHCPQP
jgi:hypothetical protein